MENDLKQLMTPDEVRSIVERLAGEIEADLKDRNPVLIGVLKGAFVFLSDLVRAVRFPVEVDFVQTASYGLNERPAEEVLIISDITADIRGRDVVLVEGIIDRGVTMRVLSSHLKAKGPSSVRLCTLLLRSGGRAGKIDYIGRHIDEGFVAGYGMDYMEGYRNLPGVYLLERKNEKARSPLKT